MRLSSHPNRFPVKTTLSASFACLLGVVMSITVASPAAGAVADPATYVNTLIGSSNSGETFPGADTPYGMVQWSPENTAGNQTRTVEPGGYGYNATRIRGFALTHMSGTGCAGGYGDIPFLPYAGSVNSSPSADTTDAKYASNFSHTNETATAGYYQVGLSSGVNVELTATTRTGSGRVTYPAEQTASMLVRTSNSEVGSSAAQTTINAAARTISGSVTSGNFCGYINQIGRRSYYTLHFHAVFDQPFTTTGTWQDGTLRPGTTSASGGTTYGTDGWPVAGRGSGGFVTFAPGQTVNVRVGISFVSLANAQANLQAENPAGTTFETVRQRAHDAWNTELSRIELTGGTTAQLTTFYTALYHSLLHPNVFSDTNGQYMGMDQQVHTVSGNQRAQYANFSGWDVYRSQLQLVTLLRPDVGSDIAQPEQRLYIQNRNENGSWPAFNPANDDGFAEGSGAQYTWMVPFNVKGLFDRMGGNTTATTRLDTFFHNTDGSWALTGAGGLHAEMDNEPSIGSPWLYDFSGRPYKTQQTVRQVVNTLWSSGPGGIPGQDDLGAMSSWYVWSAMGLYPLTPGRAELLLTSPLFPQIVVHRSNGVTLTINASGASAGTFYVQGLSVNGTASTKPWLPESFVTNGGTLTFTLGTTANTAWGSAAADAPPSFDTVGSPVNVALNKAATGSAACNSNETPNKAVNGSVSGGNSDKFCSTASTKFLQVDLGQSYAISSFTVRHAGAGGESTSWNTRDFDIQVSANGSTWTTLVQARANTANVSSHPVSATARYVRLNVITAEQSGIGAARIYEFEVYG